MEPIFDDAKFWLPPEFLTDEDFLLEKENNGGSLFPYEPRHGFGGFDSSVKSNTVKEGDEEDFLAGLTKQLVDSSLENDFSGGFSGTHAVPGCNDNKAWCVNRSSPVAGTGCCCQNQKSNQNSGVSSWDLYCAMAEEVARMSITAKPYLTGRGLLDPPTKLPSAALNNGTCYYNHHQQTLALQKLQAIQFQQLKQQQLMNQSRVSFNGNKNVGPVDMSSSAWSNQLPRRDVMRAVFLGDRTGKRSSTGTGVFLPRNVNHSATPKPREEKPTLSTVLVPDRLTPFMNLNLDEPVRTSTNLNDVSWRQGNNSGGFPTQLDGGIRAEQPVNEPRLPLDWAY